MDISDFTFRLVLGTGLGLLWLRFWGAKRYAGPSSLVGLVWATALGALLLGRLGYAVGEWPYFAQHPVDLLRPWAVGGWHGGASWIGGLLGAALWARVVGVPLLPTVNLLAPAALLTAVGSWWACQAINCIWGRSLRAPSAFWRPFVIDAADMYGTVLPRYAVVEAGGLLALLAALLALLSPRRAILFVLCYAAGIMALAPLRADPTFILGSLRLDLLLHGALLVFLVALQCFGNRSSELGKCQR